jgi:hypothetical protein
MSEARPNAFSYQWLKQHAEDARYTTRWQYFTNIAKGNSYRLICDQDGFYQVRPEESNSYNYKFHVFPQEHQVGEAWDAIIDIIRREGLNAKVVSPEMALKFSDLGNPQRGKMITIYADYSKGELARNWEIILCEMMQALTKADITPGVIPFDKAVIRCVENGSEIPSLISYRDEREERPAAADLINMPKTLLPDLEEDDFAGMIIDIARKIENANHQLNIKRKQRQELVISQEVNR